MRTGRPPVPVLQRLLAKIEVAENGCWLWIGKLQNGGYGQIKVPDGTAKGKTKYVHRVAYEEMVGRIPKELELDHLCRERRCCNPDHLEPVPRSVNVLRGVGWAAQNAKVTHCPHGHAFDKANTYHTRTGHRACRACARERNKRHRERRREGK